MYESILVPLDGGPGDRVILDHVTRLARFCDSRVTLLHVAGGWRGRYFSGRLTAPEEAELESYLRERVGELEGAGVEAHAELRYGETSERILEVAAELGCDLIAMSTHGHKGLLDVVFGSPAAQVRHGTRIPVLLIRS